MKQAKESEEVEEEEVEEEEEEDALSVACQGNLPGVESRPSNALTSLLTCYWLDQARISETSIHACSGCSWLLYLEGYLGGQGDLVSGLLMGITCLLYGL